MPKIALSQQLVKSTTCPLGKAKWDLFDSNCKGLMLETRSTGGKTFYLRYQDTRGKTRQLKLADERDISYIQAKQLADKHRNSIAMGLDPSEEKQSLKQAPTVAQFILQSYMPFVQGYKRSWKCDLSLLKNHVEPVWGKKYLDQVTKADVVALFAGHRKKYTPGSCNRLLILIRYMFTLALRWETPGLKTNPAKDHPLLKEQNQRERFLSEPDAQALFAAIKQSINPMLQHIIPMLILTGARKREVLDARWEDIDFEHKSWRIHTTKSGQPRHVPLSDGAIAVLEALPRDSEWIFANEDTGKPYASIYASWHTARTRAGLADVRVHDLRHSFASFLVNAGRSIYEVQRLLGHAHIRTTQRYAHLSKDTLLDATNAVNSAVGHVFMPVLPTSPAVQVQLAQ
jgi:integrase